jgi:hypothetical protein
MMATTAFEPIAATRTGDFGLMLGALTLARLASVYDPPLNRR